jgi:hypothetical protein
VTAVAYFLAGFSLGLSVGVCLTLVALNHYGKIRWPRTAACVARELEAGLRDGSITLDPASHPPRPSGP